MASIRSFLSRFVFRRADDAVVEGGLYSVRQEDGTLRVIKVLKLDPQGVHVRQYSNVLREHPKDIDERTLYMAGLKEPQESLGIGHMPIARASFESWGARLIKGAVVVEEELEGYKMWEEANGGYFH